MFYSFDDVTTKLTSWNWCDRWNVVFEHYLICDALHYTSELSSLIDTLDFFDDSINLICNVFFNANHWTVDRDARFGPKVGQTCPKLDKTGIFQTECQYIFARRTKMYWHLFWKSPWLVVFMANLNNFWPKYVTPAFDNPALFWPVSDIRARTVHPSVKCTISLESGCLLPYHVW